MSGEAWDEADLALEQLRREYEALKSQSLTGTLVTSDRGFLDACARFQERAIKAARGVPSPLALAFARAAAREPATPGPIRTTVLYHPPKRSEYRTHVDKSKSLCGEPLRLLHTFLAQMHERGGCPREPFLSGPRASDHRRVDVSLTRHVRHQRCLDAARGLDENATRFSDAHSRVECFMLEKDESTIAVEVPVWIAEHERGPLAVDVPTSEHLSGHIDVLAIENGNVCVWDYKPKAARERFAAAQVLLYAYMLSVRTGLSLEHFRCGYFDDEECFEFVPSVDALARLTNDVRVARSRPEQGPTPAPSPPATDASRPARRAPLSPEQRQAQRVPDLAALGVQRPHPDMNDTETYSWHLFVHGNKAADVAQQRQMQESTVYNHLAKAIRCGVLPLEDVVDRAAGEAISEALRQLPEGEHSTKRVFEALNGQYGYGLIFCVQADMMRAQ